MSFNKRKVDYSGKYPVIALLKYLPFIGAFIVLVPWELSYTYRLWSEAE